MKPLGKLKSEQEAENAREMSRNREVHFANSRLHPFFFFWGGEKYFSTGNARN